MHIYLLGRVRRTGHSRRAAASTYSGVCTIEPVRAELILRCCYTNHYSADGCPLSCVLYFLCVGGVDGCCRCRGVDYRDHSPDGFRSTAELSSVKLFFTTGVVFFRVSLLSFFPHTIPFFFCHSASCFMSPFVFFRVCFPHTFLRVGPRYKQDRRKKDNKAKHKATGTCFFPACLSDVRITSFFAWRFRTTLHGPLRVDHTDVKTIQKGARDGGRMAD